MNKYVIVCLIELRSYWISISKCLVTNCITKLMTFLTRNFNVFKVMFHKVLRSNRCSNITYLKMMLFLKHKQSKSRYKTCKMLKTNHFMSKFRIYLVKWSKCNCKDNKIQMLSWGSIQISMIIL